MSDKEQQVIEQINDISKEIVRKLRKIKTEIM